MKQICKNCGRRRWFHSIHNKHNKCKKFVAEEEFTFEGKKYKMEGKKAIEQKGCGDDFDNGEIIVRCGTFIVFDNKLQLCRNCKPLEVCDNCGRTLENHHPNKDRSCKWKYTNYKPKNHSPHVISVKDTPEAIHGSVSEKSETSGTHSQQGSSRKRSFISKPTDTFNLSEKIRNWSGRKIVPYKDIKEFIKRVDKDFLDDWTNSNGKTFTLNEIREIIQKRVGELK